MEKLKRSFSFRKKKDHVPECSKPHQWQEDERKVRDGTCSFQVRYLGCIEVFESRGIQVCEEAVKALKSKKSRSVWSRMSLRKKKKKDKDIQQCKGKYQRAILYVSGDALRVVDEISKVGEQGLIVDQTIEKVSFCAPDRNHEKGFAYICRDGTTRRWMCHGFLALKESGERLSHAVGCAFAICLEKKQKREKESVTVTFNEKGTSFTRTGSFRHTTLTERLADPQSAIIAEPVPLGAVHNVNAVQRPHATQDMLIRQGSFRGFSKLNESSPFKRQLSLRLNDLPSTLERQQDLTNNGFQNPNGPGKVSPIPEASPTKEQSDDTIAEMCQQLTEGLSALTSQDPFGQASGAHHTQPAANYTNTPHSTAYTTPGQQSSHIPHPGVAPIQQSNPWASPPSGASSGASKTGASKVSDAEFWLHSTASSVSQSPQVSSHTAHPLSTTAMMNGAVQPPYAPHHAPPASRAPQLSNLRSQSLDTAEVYGRPAGQRGPTLHELSTRNPLAFQSVTNGTSSAHSTRSGAVPATGGIDPFDAAWAAKAVNKNNNTNPFQKHDTVTKTFEANV